MSSWTITHSEYKDSDVDWIGRVPNHWQLLPARVAVSNLAEKNEGAENQNYLSLVAGRGVIPYADKGEMGNKKPDDLSKCKIVHRGNIVINSMNFFIGAYGMSEYNGVCSPVYIVLDVNQTTMERRFALRVFGDASFQLYLATFGNGILAHRAAIGWDDIKGTYLPFPPLGEQTQIAKFLDYETGKIDRLIEKQEQLIALLKEKRQAVISHAVTKGLNPDAPLRHSGIEWLGEVPAHWGEYPLGALFVLKHGYPFDSSRFDVSGKFIVMTPGNFNERGGFRSKTPEKFYTGTDFPNEFILNNDDLLVAMTEQGPGLLGSALFVPQKGTYVHNQRLGLVQGLDAEIVDTRYLFHLFNSSRYRAEIGSNVTGSTVRHTSPKKIRSVKVWLPTLDEQQEIAYFLDDRLVKFDKMEEKTEEIIVLLKERRTALISAAVTGKIDVRGWQSPHPHPSPSPQSPSPHHP